MRFQRTFLLAGSIVLLSGLAWFGYSRLRAPESVGLLVTPSSFDFGAVQGKSEATFELVNSGRRLLTILGISTSCGCTTAWVDQVALGPGEKTSLHVSFDPTIHEGIEGPVVRQVYLRTDAPDQSEITIELHATVIPAGEVQS